MASGQGKVDSKQKEALDDGPAEAGDEAPTEGGQTYPAGASDYSSEMTVEFWATGMQCVSVKYLKDDEKFKARSEQAMEESVSDFFVDTCQIFPKSDTDLSKFIYEQSSDIDRHYKIVSGSSVEFFIEPLHSCIGDLDVLNVKTYHLAFTEATPILPVDIRNIADTTKCALIEPYDDYPAFVRLWYFGDLKYNWAKKIFEFIPLKVGILSLHVLTVRSLLPNDSIRTGPAITYGKANDLSFDEVLCVWCPDWPKQAKHWPYRRRKYGWPTTAIIQEVVRNGCHVVPAKHPDCRNDEHQWRLSFSVAEVVLLQSWTPTQQIVYHMLRFCAKRELIKKDCPKEDEVLCTYHFKTLMLWSCEQISPEWWNSTSVIKICCYLLQKLAKWLKEKTCPNYFIPRANLFHNNLNRKIGDETMERFMKFCDSEFLCRWFVTYYIYPLIPVTLRKMDAFRLPISCDIMDGRHTSQISIPFDEFMLYTCKVRKLCNPKSIDVYFSCKFYHFLSLSENCEKLTVAEHYSGLIASTNWREIELMPSKVLESCFKFYESMLLILNAVHLIDSTKMQIDTERFINVVRQVLMKPKFIRSMHHNFPKHWETDLNGGQLHFIKAIDLMENLNRSTDDVEFQIVSQTSKYLLQKALTSEDSKTNAIAIATLTYMAALNFAASEYETAIDLCSVVLSTETDDDKETLNAGCLFYVDDIARIVGFYLLFRQIKKNLHCSRKLYLLDLRLTPEVFAHHLIMLSQERTHSFLELNYDFRTPTFPFDKILVTVTSWRSTAISKKASRLRVYERTKPANKLEALIESFMPAEDGIITQELMKYSIENMMLFYNAICQDFGINCSTVDCYHAAYLYSCRKYPEVLHLCEKILDEPDLRSDLKELAFTNVVVMSPLDSYFDRDIQCLLGLHTFVCYLSPLNEDLCKLECTTESTFQQVFARKIYFNKLELYVFLTYPYFLKCYYFLGRHFLARYLRMRILIDCNHSNSEVLLEFKKLKSHLPFEHMICCLLQKKLR